MSFASDIQAVTLDVSGQAIEGRTRLGGVYFVAGSNSGEIVFHDGEDDQAPVRLKLASPGDDQSDNVIFPEAGILFPNGVYVDFDQAASVTLFFYGGAAYVAPPSP
jgi:hypothetical protein